MRDIAQRVRLKRNGRIALIVIDNPPVNAASRDVRQGLIDCLVQVGADDTLDAAVLLGAGNSFIAGSDLKEFEGPLDEPQLPAVIRLIEEGTKPIVAALHGAALGGGYELALACDLRVAVRGTLVGLPEVTLGVIPGAGGTQRLPRLIGMAQAIDLITTGRRIEATEAIAIGMIDVLVDDDLPDAACAAAAALVGKPRALVINRSVPDSKGEESAEAEDRALRMGKGRPQIFEAISAIRAATTMSPVAALKKERAVFQQLRLSEEARSLRHLFFAEREATRHVRRGSGLPPPIRRPAIVGGGTMGVGIAIAMLDAGFETYLAERDLNALTTATGCITSHYASAVARGLLSSAEAARRQQRLTPTTKLEQLEKCDLVVEAVFEDADVKRALMQRLDDIVAADAILATNTSYLSVGHIAKASRHPGRVAGLHFFGPDEVKRLVEVVAHDQVDARNTVRIVDFARRLGKLPIAAKDGPGFIGNRIFGAYRRQAEFLVEEGASPVEVDQAVEGFGFAMGPFAAADMSGLDIAWRMRRAADATRQASERYVTIADRLVDRGRLGRKAGLGWYRYAEGVHSRGRPDSEVDAIVAAAAEDKDMTRRRIVPRDILRRLLVTIVNEAALVLAEGTAARATDIDLVFVHGFGFPAHKGGPVRWAQHQPRGWLINTQSELERLGGSEFERGDLMLLLGLSHDPEMHEIGVTEDPVRRAARSPSEPVFRS